MTTSQGRRLGFIVFVTIAIAAMLSSAPASAQTVTTDLPDYMPGWTVTITGAGWIPGETVSLLIQEDPQLNPDVTISAVADANGTFINSSFVVPFNAGGTVYYLTATGQASHLVAYEAFTDAIGNGSLCNTLTITGCSGATPLTQHGSGLHHTHYNVTPGTTIVGKIIFQPSGSFDAFQEACTDVHNTDPNGVWLAIQSSSLGNTLICGSVSGTGTTSADPKVITFTYDAPQNGCEATIVSYKTQLGSKTAIGNYKDSNNDIVDDLLDNGSPHAVAGYAFVSSSGGDISCATVATTIHDSNHNPVTSVTTTDTVHDLATVTGTTASGTPTGTVTFTFFTNGTCSSTGTFAGTVTLDTSGVAHPSNSFGQLAVGSYSFKAHYNGSDTYAPADSSCEPLNVVLQEQSTPDVSVVKSTTTSSINAGDTASYTIVVSAGGNAPSTNVVVTDTLPGGLSWTISPSVTGCSISSGALSCTFASLSPGDSRTIIVTAPTTSASCPGLDNTVTVKADVDTNSTNNSSGPVHITVKCNPDVSVVKSTTTSSINAGDTARYTIVVSAGGNAPSTNVVVTDTLPDGLSWTISPSVTGCSISSGVLSCTFASLNPPETRSITVTATTNATNCPGFNNTATVSADVDVNTSNNSSGPIQITVKCPADVTVTKTADQGTVTGGSTIGFTITVTNTSQATAYNVKLNDPLPAGAGGDIFWTIDTSGTGLGAGTSPSSFQITGSMGSQVLTLNPPTGITLAVGVSLKVHITSPTNAADAATTGFDTTGTVASGTISLNTAKNYAVLGLKNTQISNSLVTIHGNEGVSQGGKLTNMAPSAITGNVYEYASGEYSGPGTLVGSLMINPSLLTQNDTDALNASSTAAGLAATQMFGNISSKTTVVGTSGLNVIKINGNITASLILKGTPTSVFVVNVTGTVTLKGSSTLGLSGGVTANHVLYNFTGKSGTISTDVGNVICGTLLAPTYSFNLDGAFFGEVIGGGKSIVLMSGATVNAMITNIATVSADNDSNAGNNSSSATITLQ